MLRYASNIGIEGKHGHVGNDVEDYVCKVFSLRYINVAFCQIKTSLPPKTKCGQNKQYIIKH